MVARKGEQERLDRELMTTIAKLQEETVPRVNSWVGALYFGWSPELPRGVLLVLVELQPFSRCFF